MVASLPMTCAQTMSVASGRTGLTLPGMMLDPGCRSGRLISPRPVRGPDPIQRRSLQIFVRLTATVRSAPDSSTIPSRAPCASKWSVASVIGRPVSAARISMTRCGKPAGVLMPVPTAVPPSGTSAADGSARSTRAMPLRTWAAYPANSWPSVTGVASIRCVRPDLTTSANSSALRSSDCARWSRSGSSWLTVEAVAATWIDVGNTSLLDCDALTWSFGCTSRPSERVASVAMTSLVFMLLDVPEPVWKTSMGKCASWAPVATSCAAATIASARSPSRMPSSAFARAQAALICASALIWAGSIGVPEIGKFSTARCVWARQSASAGTLTSPMVSCSMRQAVSFSLMTPR